MKSRSVLLISHRLSFFAQADHVVVLDQKGRVVEAGAPRAPLQTPGSKLGQLHEAAVAELGFAASESSDGEVRAQATESASQIAIKPVESGIVSSCRTCSGLGPSPKWPILAGARGRSRSPRAQTGRPSAGKDRKYRENSKVRIDLALSPRD